MNQEPVLNFKINNALVYVGKYAWLFLVVQTITRHVQWGINVGPFGEKGEEITWKDKDFMAA